MRRANLPELRSVNGVLSRQQMEEHHADGVDLAGNRRRLALHELRRHVGRRAAWELLDSAFVRESEIHQQNSAALLAHDVAGFDIAVEQSGGMYCANRPRDIDTHERCLTGTQRTLDREQARERLALYEVAPEPDPPFVPVHPVDRQDVGMSHSRNRPGFPEQRAGFVVSIETSGQEELQRDLTLERRVERAIDLAERSSPHTLQPLERPPTLQRLCGRALARRSRSDLGFFQSSLLVVDEVQV